MSGFQEFGVQMRVYLFMQELNHSLDPSIPHFILGWAMVAQDYRFCCRYGRLRWRIPRFGFSRRISFPGWKMHAIVIFRDSWLPKSCHAFDIIRQIRRMTGSVARPTMRSTIVFPIFHFQIQYPCDLVCLFSMQMKRACDILKIQIIIILLVYLISSMIGKMGFFISGMKLAIFIGRRPWDEDRTPGSDRRPADLLTVLSVICRQSLYHFLPRIAIDFLLNPPFGLEEGTWPLKTMQHPSGAIRPPTPGIANKGLDWKPLFLTTREV